MDQATDLRQLVRQDRQHARQKPLDSPRLVAVASGKGGIGTTTVAVQLAVALARSGRPTLLVDADFHQPDVAHQCQLHDSYSVADVLSGQHDVHEVLVRGPGGIQVLPGAWSSAQAVDCSPPAQERLISSLRGLGAYAEFVVLDVGNHRDRTARRFWHAVDQVLVVSTPDATTLMNVYAAIKVLSDGDLTLPIGTVVNQASDDATATEVHQRLALACRRFLGRTLQTAGSLPFEAHPSALPLVPSSPSGSVAMLAQLGVAPHWERLANWVVQHTQLPEQRAAAALAMPTDWSKVAVTPEQALEAN